jgi:hypothetical protein
VGVRAGLIWLSKGAGAVVKISRKSGELLDKLCNY